LLLVPVLFVHQAMRRGLQIGLSPRPLQPAQRARRRAPFRRSSATTARAVRADRIILLPGLCKAAGNYALWCRGGAFGYVTKPMADGEVQSRLAETTKLAKQIHVFPVFYAALSESDQMKRFFFLFLAIERQTHQTYKHVNQHSTRSAILTPPGRVARNVDKFVELRNKQLSNLGDKFVWCAISHWQHLDDADIGVFFRLKDLRDDLAHGNITTVPEDALPAVEQLAKKVLRQ
jgi:hypothetical protein